MEQTRIKVDILPNQFLNEDGIYNKDEALDFCGKIAGVCYDEEGYEHISHEDKEKTKKRIDRTLSSKHLSIYDHPMITFYIQNLPKILAMVLNNEGYYDTSEKSARYTKVVRTEGSIITKDEEQLYNKWFNIFQEKISNEYPFLDKSKIKSLSQENARYLVTVFMPTQMVHTISLRQANNLTAWMRKYMFECNKNDFNNKLCNSMQQLIDEFDRLNVLVPELQTNDKNNNLSLFSNNIDKRMNFLKQNQYSLKYNGSLAYLAQAQRHRKIHYCMQQLDRPEIFVPPIILDDDTLLNEWYKDSKKVMHLTPQGSLVQISETGDIEDFVEKSKERLCSAAQLEIMRKTRDNMLELKRMQNQNPDPIIFDLTPYVCGPRCTFPDYKCPSGCKFEPKLRLGRKI